MFSLRIDKEPPAVTPCATCNYGDPNTMPHVLTEQALPTPRTAASSKAQTGTPSIFTAMEAQLFNSEVYQQVLADLQALTGEAAEAVQTLMTSLGKEALRLAFQTLSQNYQVVPAQAARPAKRRPAPPPRRLQTVSSTPTAPSTSAAVAAPRAAVSPDPAQPTPDKTSRFRRMSKAERAQLLAQERETTCRQIGTTLRQARESQGISIGQLYSKTLVQVFYIKALEAGCVEQLPEDIYLRGFIRRLGNALGLDGNALAKSLPKQLNESPVPSWYSPDMKNARKSIGGVTPIHLYAGYTATMATAVGGLGWLTSQQQPIYAQPEIEPDAAQTAPSFQQAEQTVDLDQQASQAIAPPEAL